MMTNDHASINSQYLRRSCPNCGSDEGERTPAVVESASRAEDLDFDRNRASWSSFSVEKIIFSYHRCPRCGQLYCPCYFSPDQLAELYSDMVPNMEDATPDAVRRTQRGYVRHFFRYHPVEGDYLEIGPDVGYFAEAVLQRRPMPRCWLFEPNRQVHGELLRRVDGTPAELLTEMFDLSPVPEQQVAVAAMVHVLDHLPEPKPFLEQMFAKLRPGGLLVVVVHNERSLLPRSMGCRCPIYCLSHPQIFNPRTLDRMLRDVGFAEVDVVRSTNYFPLTYLIQNIFIALSRKQPRLPTWPWLQIPVKLGNSIAVARKDA